jgi:acetylornithine deacetylase/succinyl-diaminopimelate desuccinylase-like protein
MAATLDTVSGGRLEYGIGSGWNRRECEQYGHTFSPYATRCRQVAEALEIAKRVWTQDEVTYVGRQYSVRYLTSYPKPVQKPTPPIVVGGKGRHIARIAAVETLLDVDDHLPLTVKILIEGEEEIDNPHLPPFVRDHKDLLNADGCIWEGGLKDPTGRPTLYLGVKGMLYVELSVYGPARDQHSMWAPIMTNPAWRLVEALRTLRTADEDISIQEFSEDIKEPSEQDRELLSAIPFEEKKYADVFGVKAFRKDLAGQELVEELFLAPTCTICGLVAGYTGHGAKTVLPAPASAKLDFRLVPEQSPDAILNRLRSHLAERDF